MVQRNEIQRRECDISQAVEMAQMLMFDLAYRDYGFTRKALASATQIPPTTIKSYEEGTGMPMAAFIKLARVKGFPNELLNLVLDVADKAVCDGEEDETDLDDAARAAVQFLAGYVNARHPESSSGIKIDHTEKPGLRLAASGLKDRAGKVAA